MADFDFPSDFIDRLYAVAMEPERFTEIVEVWHERLSRAAPDAKVRFFEEIEYLDNHLRRAESLLAIATNHEDLLPTPVYERLQSEPQAMILVDAARVIRGCNPAAEKTFHVAENDSLDAMPLEEHTLSEISLHLRDLNAIGRSPQSAELLKAWRRDTDDPVILAISTLTTSSGRTLLAIRSVDFVWPEKITPLLQDAFDLTPAEMEVMKLLAEGHPIKDIATTRDASIATVRSQIRAIYEKTSTRNQSELMRAMLGLANLDLIDRFTLTGVFGQSSVPSRKPYPRESNRHLLDLPDGRLLDFAVFGDVDGLPCIHFHNEFFGDGWPASMVDLAVKKGLKIIVPARAGNGRSSDYSGSTSTFGQTTQDTLFLMETLGIDRAAHLSFMSGAAFSLSFANQHPDKTAGMVVLAPTFPFSAPDVTEDLPYFHRILSQIIHEHSRLLEFLCKTGIAFHNRVGTERFFRTFARHRPADLATLDDPVALTAMMHGARICGAQGHKGFYNDFRETLPDAWELFQKIECPVEIIMGEETSRGATLALRALTETRPNFYQTIAPGGAHYVMYSHGTVVVDALDRVWSRAQNDCLDIPK